MNKFRLMNSRFASPNDSGHILGIDLRKAAQQGEKQAAFQHILTISLDNNLNFTKKY